MVIIASDSGNWEGGASGAFEAVLARAGVAAGLGPGLRRERGRGARGGVGAGPAARAWACGAGRWGWVVSAAGEPAQNGARAGVDVGGIMVTGGFWDTGGCALRRSDFECGRGWERWV